MATAQEYSGLARGLATANQYMAERPEREARRAEAKMRQEQANIQMQEFQRNAPVREAESERALAQAQQDTRKLYATNLADSTDRAFDNYEQDGEVRHLNAFLAKAKQNPVGATNWSKWVTFDKLTQTPETEAILAQAGITEVDEFFANPELVKSKVMGIDAEGNRVMLDMNKLEQATGYASRTNAKTLTQLRQRAEIEELLRGTQSAESQMILGIKEEKPGRTWTEAVDIYYSAKNQGKVTGSAKERIAQEYLDKGLASTYQDALNMASRDVASPTAASQDLEQADTVRAQLDELAGGDFLSADMGDPAIARKAGRYITELERLTGSELTTEDKRVVRQLKQLTALGFEAGTELTDEQTGIADSALRDFKALIGNAVGGSTGVAAYQTFRNTLIRAMSGATVTPSEEQSVTRALGTLKQQTGPVLNKLLVQLRDIKTQLQSIYNTNDEYVAQYYLGTSLDNIDNTIAAVDARVDMFRDVVRAKEGGTAVQFSGEPLGQASDDPAERQRQLDQFFGVR